MTFDYWNTLCCEPPGGYLLGLRLEAMSQELVDSVVWSAGVALSVLTAAYDAVPFGVDSPGVSFPHSPE